MSNSFIALRAEERVLKAGAKNSKGQLRKEAKEVANLFFFECVWGRDEANGTVWFEHRSRCTHDSMFKEPFRVNILVDYRKMQRTLKGVRVDRWGGMEMDDV